MNHTSAEFQMTVPQERTSMTEAMISRQAQEVQAAMVIAKRFPRDENAAYTKIMTACQRKRLAEEAEYTYPKGGKQINGPSIRLAEVAAQGWGNIDYGVLELEQRNGESHCMAYAWDLETNTRRTMTFTVKHARQAKGNVQQLSDPRDIYEMVSNQGARRVRACILAVIPGDVIDAAVDQCRKTLVAGETKPLKDSVREMLLYFKDTYQVSQEMIEKYIGWKIDAFTLNDVLKLRGVAKSLKDGMAKREDYFDIRSSYESVGTKTEEAFKNQQQKENKAEEPKPAEGGDEGIDLDGFDPDADELSFEQS